MITKKLIFVPFEIKSSPEFRGLLSNIQNSNKKASQKSNLPLSVLFFSLAFNILLTLCILATLLLPREAVTLGVKRFFVGFCFIVIIAAFSI